MHPEIQIRDLTGALGAEVRGIDLSNAIGPDVRSALLEAFHRYGVLAIRDQSWNHDDQIALGRIFGELDTHPIVKSIDTHPEIIRVIKPRGEPAYFGTAWHTDNSFFESPSAITILYAERVPPVGGDTVFASMEKAWEGFSEPMQRFLEPLRAIHVARSAYDPNRVGPEKFNGRAAMQYIDDPEAIAMRAVHPVVRTHPETGRKSLYVNPTFTDRIVGLSRAESDALLAMLYAESTRPERTCRLRWEAGTVAIWDNRCVQHYAVDDYTDFERVMYRVTVRGERPA